MGAAQVIISKGASTDIAALANGQDRTTVALNALAEALKEGTLSPQQRSQLETIADQFSAKAALSQASPSESPSATLAPAIQKEYPDSRKGFGPHQAIEFNVTVNSRVMASVLLEELLGSDASVLISDWGSRADFNKNAPTDSKAVLFTGSNNKARNTDYAAGGDTTTQQDDFAGVGLQFADDLQATIVCATLVKKAKDAGLDLRKAASTWTSEQSEALEKLNPLEIDLLTKLRDGAVRTSSGALYVGGVGRLRAYRFFYGSSDALFWAFGGVASAELKS